MSCPLCAGRPLCTHKKRRPKTKPAEVRSNVMEGPGPEDPARGPRWAGPYWIAHCLRCGHVRIGKEADRGEWAPQFRKEHVHEEGS